MSDPAKPPSETLTVLRSIDLSLRTLVVIAQKKAEARVTTAAVAIAPAVASDRDLDGKYGDPEVKFNPRDWTGEPIKGLHMSACPAEALDMLAETFDYFAQKAEETNEVYNGKLVAPYKRIDAARARGWAARIRAGKVAAPADDKGWADPKLYGDGL
jgi:hypothetical protein